MGKPRAADGVVGLFAGIGGVPGEIERFATKDGATFEYMDLYDRGVARYFDVTEAPPERGRPEVGDTLSLDEVVDRTLAVHSGPTANETVWAEPELDI